MTHRWSRGPHFDRCERCGMYRRQRRVHSRTIGGRIATEYAAHQHGPWHEEALWRPRCGDPSAVAGVLATECGKAGALP